MKRCGKLCIALAAAVFLAAGCGKTDPGAASGQGEWGYQPEFIDMEEEKISAEDLRLAEDTICYLTPEDEVSEEVYAPDLNRYSLKDRERTVVSLDWQTETGDAEEQILSRDIRLFDVGKEGNIICIAREERKARDPGEESETRYFFYGFDESGGQIFAQDISEWLDGIAPVLLAGEDGSYLASGSCVRRFDETGKIQGSISVGSGESRITGLGYGGDGRLYAAYQTIEGGDSLEGFVILSGDTEACALAKLDFGAGTAEDVRADFAYGAEGLFPGEEEDLLVYDSRAVYEYDVETGESRKLFDWLDCDVNGSYAKVLGTLEDGSVAAVYTDGGAGVYSAVSVAVGSTTSFYTDGSLDQGNTGLVLLKKTRIDPEQVKKTLVVAVLSDDNFLRDAAVAFNRSSSEYRVEIRQYYDSTGDGTYEDALVNLNNAIASDNCPDIISLAGLDAETLAEKGVFEDLNPYLEQSGALSREDILESVLKAYTFEDRLIAIPRRFMVQTAVGDAGELDAAGAWTVEQVIAYAEAHPGAELFDQGTKDSVLDYLMRCSQETFIDWETGECRFDSELFQKLLSFVNRYPDEADQGAALSSEWDRLADGGLLLSKEVLSDFNSVQVYMEMFQKKVKYIGYPTSDGSGGHIIVNAEQTYGISSQSDKKEGAWQFLENILTRETDSRFQTGFPSSRSRLRLEAKEALNSGYELDKEGNPLLDENGEPIAASLGFSMMYYDMSSNRTYTYRPPVQEEIDIVLEVLDQVRLAPEENSQIMNIIREESAAFFAGQKTVEEAAAGVQNRVGLYVSENR